VYLNRHPLRPEAILRLSPSSPKFKIQNPKFIIAASRLFRHLAPFCVFCAFLRQGIQQPRKSSKSTKFCHLQVPGFKFPPSLAPPHPPPITRPSPREVRATSVGPATSLGLDYEPTTRNIYIQNSNCDLFSFSGSRFCISMNFLINSHVNDDLEYLSRAY
jgi:hypothetical protein